MNSKDYNETADKIIEAVGGKENISYFAHCFTRLRFNVIDKGLIDLKSFDSIKDVIGAQWSANQLQIIIGQEVEDLYDVICDKYGFSKENSIDEVVKEDLKPTNTKKTFKNLFENFITTITACISPLIIVFTVGGLIRLLVALLGSQILGILPDDSDILVLFSMVGDACFKYFPIYVAYSAAKRFNASVPLAMILACLLLHPTLGTMVDEGTRFTVYGIPVIPTYYVNSFIPTFLITWILAKVERFFKNLFPKVINGILYPVCTILVMLPLALCVLGPIGTILGALLANLIVWLKDIFGPFATGLVGALYPLLIATGMHHALNSAAFIEYVKNGYDKCIYAASYIMDFQLMSLCFASLIKSKKAENKSYALSCIATEGIGGISEPTIFGIMLKNKKNILYVLIGGFVAGFYIGLMDVTCYVFAPSGFLSVLAYTGGSLSNFVHGAIACALAFFIPFILALIFGLGLEEGEESNEKVINTK